MTTTSDDTSDDADIARMQAKISSILMLISYAMGAVGIYLGLQGGAAAFQWFCLLAVGGPTAAGFVRHVLLWRGDAARLGFETTDPSWMWEVGFANLAIAVAAVLSVALHWGNEAQATVVMIMGVYMLGATFVHLADRMRKKSAYERKVIVSIGLPLAYGIMLLIGGVANV